MYRLVLLFPDESIRLLSKVFGRRSTTVDTGKLHVVFRFLTGINAWRASDDTSSLSKALGKFTSTSQNAEQEAVLADWNGEFPSVDCPWKKNNRALNAMVEKGTSRLLPEFSEVAGFS